MKIKIESSEKRSYRSPQMERIILDNEISLALTSPADLPLWSENQDNSIIDPI